MSTLPTSLPLPAFQLPPGTERPPVEVDSTENPGLVVPVFTSVAAASLLDGLRAAKVLLDRIPTREIARALGETGARFLDPTDPIKLNAESRVALESGLSPSSARRVVEGMARDWTRDRLAALLRADFPEPSALDGFVSTVEGDAVLAVSGDLSFHIGSGNVPGVGTTSIIRSLLVKCPILLKPGREDVALPCAFARALEERHPDLARAVAVAYWPRGRGGDLEALALASSDRIVVYGGNAFIREIRGRAPIGTAFIAYSHRVSVGAVGRELLADKSTALSVAADAAGAASAYDGRGCVSPKIIWVESGGATSPGTWASMLADQLNLVEHRFPSAPLDMAGAAALQQLLGTAELHRAAGGANASFLGSSARWGVFLEPRRDAPLDLLGPGRSVLVRPIDRLDGLSEVLRPFSTLLQSVALAVSPDRRAELTRRLAAVGTTRVTTFARLAWPPAWWRHDGAGPLQALVRWTAVELEGLTRETSPDGARDSDNP